MMMVVVMLMMLVKADDVDEDHDDYAGVLVCVCLTKKCPTHQKQKFHLRCM